MAYYNCLLIDSDNTLLDFDAAMAAAFHETMQQFELPDTTEAMEAYHQINNALWASLEKGQIRQDKLLVERFLRFTQTMGEKRDAVKMNEFYLNRLSAHADILPGADETLKELAEVATIVILSNGIDTVQRQRLQLSGLEQYADGIYTSQSVGAAKPARKIFDVALAELGVTNREKVLVVGDSLGADIQGGVNAGLATCWCNFKNEENNTQIKPTHIVRGYEELLRVVMDEEELSNVGSSEKRHKL
ncbi:MAG: YjjG family noncanonical pyrimidine nucleotidase [Oscillospiraceae bacterium]|nr:YjjG family noncanonical pyrimidine nucleotidase [Oscillospiraceae bacterium]